MKIKKAIALMIGLVLIVSLALPGTLAVSADQSAATGTLTLAGGTVSSVPEEKEASTTEGTEASTTEGTEASTTEGTEASTEGTDQTTAPTETEPSAPTEVTEPTQTTLPTEPETPSFDPQTVYDQLMACTTVEEMDAILDTLTEEQFAQFTEEMLEDIKAHYAELAPADTSDWIPAVNVTNVAPLLPPVSGRSPLRTFSAVAPYANDATGSDSEGMHRSKTATVNDDGTYTIRLEAYATGESVITTVEEEVPTDIVLVLDQSGSMADCINCGGEFDEGNVCSFRQAGTAGTLTPKAGTVYYYYDWFGEHYDTAYHCDGADGHTEGWYSSHGSAFGYDYSQKLMDNTQLYVGVRHQSRISALKSAVTSFVNSVAEKSKGADGTANTEDDIDHRISIVGFASDNCGSSRYWNTELLSTKNEVNYSSAGDNDYKNSLVSASVNGSVNPRLTTAINRITANGGTAINLGTEMANKVLEQHKNDTGRNKVVIIFTDGVPGIYTGDSDDLRTSSYANPAIANTYKSGNTYGATVYTIGVFSGADGSNPSSLTDSPNWNNTPVANKFMHLLSTNYPDAQAMDNTGAVNDKLSGSDTYYLSAGDSDALSNIFQKISDNIRDDSVKTTLDDKAVIKDIVSPYFSIPTDAEQITVKTAVCNGTDSDGKLTFGTETDSDLTATISGDTVSVTGFNFKENWCGSETAEGKTTYRGKKLIIEFKVARKDGFLGGNDVPTNTSAGVYKDGNAEKPILEFEQPTVNVPIDDVNVTATEKNVYLLGSVTADQLKNDATVKVGGVELKLGETNYGLEPWQTEYVNITVTVTDEDGKEIPTDGLTSLSDDTEYNITVKVTPNEQRLPESSGKAATERTGTGNGNINVFKPELTFKDSTAYYGDAVPDLDGNCTKTEWKHGNALSTAVTMTGDAPRLDITCEPETSKISDEKINTMQDIGVDVTVKIGSTDVTDKTTFHHTDCEDQTCTLPQGMKFLIHVKSCTLTIEKKGWDEIDENQSFVFNVTDAAGNSVTRVVIAMVDMGSQTSKSVTIKGLKAGTYTVTEDTGWSWRYEPEENGQTVTLTANTDNGTVTFTNEREKDKWLSGDAYAKNVFDYFKKSN